MCIFFAINNTFILGTHFILSNIAIREAFLLENDINFKGIREPGQRRYMSLIYKNISDIKNFNFDEIIKTFSKIKNIDINKTEFKAEYNILNLLNQISLISPNEKKITGIYISKDIVPYWNLSCDKYLPSFVSTAITNVVTIKGLTYDPKSCYGHEKKYGFLRYKKYNKHPSYTKLNKTDLCKIAINEKLKKIIEIVKYNDLFIFITYECRS
jgi:hypothetical protein